MVDLSMFVMGRRTFNGVGHIHIVKIIIVKREREREREREKKYNKIINNLSMNYIVI